MSVLQTASLARGVVSRTLACRVSAPSAVPDLKAADLKSPSSRGALLAQRYSSSRGLCSRAKRTAMCSAKGAGHNAIAATTGKVRQLLMRSVHLAVGTQYRMPESAISLTYVTRDGHSLTGRRSSVLLKLVWKSARVCWPCVFGVCLDHCTDDRGKSASYSTTQGQHLPPALPLLGSPGRLYVS